MTQGIIVLEGPDGCGKTTLARHLVQRYGAFYIHGRVHKDCWKYHTAAVSLAAKKSRDQLVVIDRNWLSECVYGPAFRGNSQYTPGERCVDRVLLKHAALHVMCLPDDRDRVVAQFERLKNDRFEHFDSVDEVTQRYWDFWFGNKESDPLENYATLLAYYGGVRQMRHDWIRYDFHRDGDDMDLTCRALLLKLASLRRHQHQPALSPRHPNILGYLPTADVLFVGERLGDPDGPTQWPFYARGQSPEYLNHALALIGWNEAKGMWTNIQHDDQHVSAVMAAKPELKLVPLGKVPERLCERLGYDVSRAVPHPQWERRFNRRGNWGGLYFEKLDRVTQDVSMQCEPRVVPTHHDAAESRGGSLPAWKADARASGAPVAGGHDATRYDGQRAKLGS